MFRVVEDLPAIASGVQDIEQVETEAIEPDAADHSGVSSRLPDRLQMAQRQPGPITQQQGDFWAR